MEKIAGKAMWEYALKPQMLDKIVEKSEFTEKDSFEIDKIITMTSLERRQLNFRIANLSNEGIIYYCVF